MSSSSTTRDWIAGLSAIGAANMTVISLRQLGIVHHLPDPPLHGFDSNAVVMSQPSKVFGMPDAPLGALGLAANIPLALLGGADRDRTRRWLPVAIAAKGVVEVSVAAWFLWQMKTRVRRWCAYCLLGASLSAAIATLALSEAGEALPARRDRLIGAGVALAIAAATFSVLTALERRRETRAASAPFE